MSKEDQEAKKILRDLRTNSLLQPLADSTTLARETYPKRHHQALCHYPTMPCAYNTLFNLLGGHELKSKTLADDTRSALTRERDLKIHDWKITGTKQLPWAIIRFDNLTDRLLNLIIEMVNLSLRKAHSLTQGQKVLLESEFSDAAHAAHSDGRNVTNVCQEILIKHPFTNTPECVEDMTTYITNKYPKLDPIDAPGVTRSAAEIAEAQALLDTKLKEYMSGLTSQ